MQPIKQILVPTDFSGLSARALDYARMLADACGASLHVIHVLGDPLAEPDVLSREQQEACARLDATLDERDRTTRGATTACVPGTPAAEIVRYAADHGIDVIVMGTHAHGRSFRMAAGSIADAVLGGAPCAVLAVKDPQARAAAGLRSGVSGAEQTEFEERELAEVPEFFTRRNGATEDNGGQPGSLDRCEPRAPRSARTGGVRITRDESRTILQALISRDPPPPVAGRRPAGARLPVVSNRPVALRSPPMLRSSVLKLRYLRPLSLLDLR